MKKILLLLIIILSVHNLFSQTTISYLKSISDKKIKNHFDTQILKDIRCVNFTIIEKDSTETWYSNYESNKNMSFKYLKVSFTYSLYSKRIRNKFEFIVTVSKNREVDTGFLANIPPCIMKNFECGYITKDSAIVIAKKDSILFPENISTEFEKPYYKKEFYWVIKGEKVQLGIKPKRFFRSSTKRWTSSVKYINAKTGEIISWQKYNLPD
jgi:hypothetical protein